jgi:hypothetical protein
MHCHAYGTVHSSSASINLNQRANGIPTAAVTQRPSGGGNSPTQRPPTQPCAGFRPCAPFLPAGDDALPATALRASEAAAESAEAAEAAPSPAPPAPCSCARVSRAPPLGALSAPYGKNGTFFEFPYVCLEPVLVQ